MIYISFVQKFDLKFSQNFAMKVRLVFQSEITDLTIAQSLKITLQLKFFRLSAKVCSETHFESLFRLTTQNNLQTFEIFRNFNLMVLMCLDGVSVRQSLVRPKKSSIEWIIRSLVSLWAILGSLVVGYSVCLSLFGRSRIRS